jgi:hypothetical protein
MKKTLLFTWLLMACSITGALAQYEGRRFVSASAGINFGTQKQDGYPSTNGYGYNFNAGFGKFKTQNMARGWSVGSVLAGGKSGIFRNGENETDSGISQFGANVGYFWQYYKHFNDKFGVFGGPNIGVAYNYTRGYDTSNGVTETKNQTFTLPFSLSAGAYYTLNERWWITGSLGFSDLFMVGYTHIDVENLDLKTGSNSNVFTYKFTPSINFPSVSLGLRYFFKN